MNYEELGQSTKTALIELYYLECLESKKKLPKNRMIDKNSISASISPIKTNVLPSEIKAEIELKVKRFLEVK